MIVVDPVLGTGRVSPNWETYSSRRVVDSYSEFHELFPAEREIFARFSRQFTGEVLDIAIGAGRTTRALAGSTRRYVGIDFSEAMVRAAKGAVSHADLRQMDMRDVPRKLAGERFDAILISFNGIDYIPWDDRCKLLEGLLSLLKKQGALAFSTHDIAEIDRERGFKIRPDIRIDASLLRTRPLSAAVRALRLPLWVLRALPNYLRNRRFEKIFDDHAYINDSGENYGLLTTYVSKKAQTATLTGCGYSQVEVLRPWLGDERASFNYFVCRA